METERASPLFGCITADELRAIEFPPEQWLVNNVIYSEGFCFIYGAEGTGKSFITFYSLVEHTSSELNPGNWFMIDDPIVDSDGNMEAELLYQATKIYGPYGHVIDCKDYEFINIDGRNNDDFRGGTCIQVRYVNIPKYEYLPYIMPRLS